MGNKWDKAETDTVAELRQNMKSFHAAISDMQAASPQMATLRQCFMELEQAVHGITNHVSMLQNERDDWRNRSAIQEQQASVVWEEFRKTRRQNSELRDDLLELYKDLRADDLPTLILRIAMRLTGAEQGLYFDADAARTLSAVGIDEMDDQPRAGLYSVARQSVQSCEATVINESQKLPDGLQLVNVAAVPVAMLGAHHGILIVANKRTGPFTEFDTDLLLSIGQHAGIALQNNRLHGELCDAFGGTVAVLADAIEAKDPYTRGHCESVAHLAERIGERLGLTSDERQTLRYGALLHDVGKIGIADEILLKPGRLTDEEYEAIRRHAVIGRDLISRVPSLSQIAPLVLYHHERMDGAGYPQGLCGEEIPLGARIIAVVDALDAMTSTRPYRPARSLADAIAELRRCAGKQFDPTLVSILEEVLVKPEKETCQGV